MNAADAAEALGMCAAYDNRTVTRIAAEAWAAALPNIRVEDAKAAIIKHYGHSREWIMPADIHEMVKVVRRDRIIDRMANGGAYVDPPESIDPDDLAAEMAWKRAFEAALGDGHDINPADEIACRAVGATRTAPALEQAYAKATRQAIADTAAAMPRIPSKTTTTERSA